jgi:tetratricopeptide (TPR) repeat protein
MNRAKQLMLFHAGPRCLASMAVLAWAGIANAALPSPELCGPLKADNYGPFDFRRDRGEPLQLVEGAHFPAKVETLISGNRGRLGQDINYTLRAFPNHHRALLSVVRYADRTQRDPPPDMMYTVECWFERAIRFAKDDAIVRMLYARYLATKSRNDEALQQLEVAGRLGGDNPITQYNVGLVLLELKQYERALVQAHLAMALGNPNEGLKNALVAAGRWQEEVTAPKPAASAGSAPAGD